MQNNWTPFIDIKLPCNPPINMWIQDWLDRAYTYELSLDLMHVLFEESETTPNRVRKHALMEAAKLLYTKLTGEIWTDDYFKPKYFNAMAELKSRVQLAKSKLSDLGGTDYSHKIGFTVKFRNEYTVDQLNSLWYCDAESVKFTNQLESFVSYKENQNK
jgi:hypothetical protein